MHRIVARGPNPIQILSTNAAMAIEHVLHPAVGEQSSRPPQGKRTLISLLWGCIDAGYWIGLGPKRVCLILTS